MLAEEGEHLAPTIHCLFGPVEWPVPIEDAMAGTVVAVELVRLAVLLELGLFGNDDRAPSPEQVNRHEAELKKHGKAHEFHRYDGAGHGFFYWHRPLYRPEQAMDGWNKIWAFFGKYLAK